MRLGGLSAESSWSYAIWPVDETTGKRARAVAPTVIDDPAAVDAFFARQAS